jgi:ComF family protein
MRSVFVYNPQSRGLVLRFKHAHDFSYLSLLEEWLARYGGKLCADADYIVPVPLHWFRLGARGFNQAAVLARLLSKRFKLSYTPRILKRLRSTASQGHLSRSERMRNVQGAFQVPRSWHSRLRGKTCLLVDDVYTTGATFDACAQALRAAGASKVLALTLSRTPHARHLL